MRSGHTSNGGGYLKDAGQGGDNWSNMASSKRGSGVVAPSACTLGAAAVYPSNIDSQYQGLSVRCVASE